jgi:hypothetical protein
VAYVARYALPQFVQRALTSTLSLDVYNDAGTQQTVDSGTVSVYAGSRLIVDAAAVSVGGSVSATYSLTAATTTDESLSDNWLGVWTLTIGGNVVQAFQRPISLVRRIFEPVITDTDLLELHPDLNALLCPDTTTWQTQRDAAFDMIERGLLKRGRRPQLIMDSWALLDLHRFQTLQLIFMDAASSVSDGRYRQLADKYSELLDKEWGSVQFRYDADEDGLLDDGAQIGSRPMLYLSSSPAWIS